MYQYSYQIYVKLMGNTCVTYHLMRLMILTDHNLTSGFLLSLSEDFYFVFLYACDIMVDQCHQVLYVTQVQPKVYGVWCTRHIYLAPLTRLFFNGLLSYIIK